MYNIIMIIDKRKVLWQPLYTQVHIHVHIHTCTCIYNITSV